MSTQEIYIWEANVDLSLEEWGKIAQQTTDATDLSAVIHKKIYSKYQHTASPVLLNILRFFKNLHHRLNNAEFQSDFQTFTDQLKSHIQAFINEPNVVWHDDKNFATQDSPEFKLALYEAIQSSGVCAYIVQDNILISSHSIQRQSNINKALAQFSAAQEHGSDVLNHQALQPQGLTEIKDQLLIFMQQHVCGREFLIERLNKKFLINKQHYGIDFKRTVNGLTHTFNIGLEYNKKQERFELRTYLHEFDFSEAYFNTEQKALLEKNNLILEDIQIEKQHLCFYFDVRQFQFIDQIEKENMFGTLDYFRFKNHEKNLLSNFLNQLDYVLNRLAPVKSLQDYVDLFVFSKETTLDPSANLDEIFNSGKLTRMYELLTYTNKSPELRQQIEHYIDGFEYPDQLDEQIKLHNQQNFNNTFQRTKVIHKYIIQPEA